MPDPRTERHASDALEEGASADELQERGDIDGLLSMGAARRAEGDEAAALDCFRAAAELGSVDARYLVALAYLTGRGVSADLAEGAGHLREAANGGSLRAKVYLANLYELGVHFARDVEKADLWYRNVARSASIEAAPGTREFELEMAALGCARHCLVLVADEKLPPKERAAHLKRAKAMGYALHQRAQARASRPPTAADAAVSALERAVPDAAASASDAPELEAASRPAPSAKPKSTPSPDPEDEPLPDPGSRWTFVQGALALVVALFFASSGAAAAWIAREGVHALAEAGRALPWIGGAADETALAILFACGALPASAVYRPSVLASAIALGAVAGAAGFYAHGSVALLPTALSQAGAAFLAAFLPTLAAVGMVGGTRLRPASAKPRPAPKKRPS